MNSLQNEPAPSGTGTRRRFLRLAATGAAGVALSSSASGRPVAASSFTFAVAHDLHYRDARCGEWLRRVTDDLRALRPRPAFLVLAGDLSEDGTAEQLTAVRRLFAPLPMPVKLLIGNHDYTVDGDRSAYEAICGPAAQLSIRPRRLPVPRARHHAGPRRLPHAHRRRHLRLGRRRAAGALARPPHDHRHAFPARPELAAPAQRRPPARAFPRAPPGRHVFRSLARHHRAPAGLHPSLDRPLLLVVAGEPRRLRRERLHALRDLAAAERRGQGLDGRAPLRAGGGRISRRRWRGAVQHDLNTSNGGQGV